MILENIAKCKQIADHYGFDAQKEIMIEECAELIQAIQKMKRAGEDCPKNDDKQTMNFISELADVFIMVTQMREFLTPALLNDFHKIVDEKITRQLGRIEEEKSEYEKWRGNVNV